MPKLETYRGVHTITLTNGKQLIFPDIDYELVETKNPQIIAFKLKNDDGNWKKGDTIEIDNNGKINLINKIIKKGR